MKIITRDFNNELFCCIQVRDIEYLAKKRLEPFVSLYCDCIRKGKTDCEFVRLKSQYEVAIVENNSAIIDFQQFVNMDSFLISRVLLNTIYDEKEKAKLVGDSLRDIIAFQKGDLDYKIPILPTHEYTCVNTELNIAASTTNLDEFYILRSTDGIPITKKDYTSFAESIIEDLTILRKLNKEEIVTTIIPKDNSILIRITKKQPKKKNSIIKRLLKK